MDGTVLFGMGGSVEQMMDVVLNDNLERVYCYERVSGEGGGGGENELVRRNRRRLSVQSAKFTVVVTGGEVVYSSDPRPIESELRESILAQIGANEGRVLAAKVRALASSDLILAPLFGDLDTVLIAEEQPAFISEPLIAEELQYENVQAVTGCPRNDDVPTNECLAKEQTSGMAVHCCSGTLGSDLICQRKGCRVVDNYADAEAFCVSRGLRLCSANEVNSNACCDKGCGFNFRLTWTSSVCDVLDDPTLASIEKETTSPTPPPTTSPPTREPSAQPTFSPSSTPTSSLTRKPSLSPTSSPTRKPSAPPSNSPVTMPITSTPTNAPSNSPIVTVITATPTIPPTAAGSSLFPNASAQDENSCPDGQCRDVSGECRGEVACVMDPCDANPCNEGEVCTPNYCGGCDRICSALAVNPSPSSPLLASPETPRPTYMFGFPTSPPILSDAPTATPTMSPMWPTYSPTVDPDPIINAVQSGPGSDGDDDGNLDTNNTMIIVFASAGSLVIALAIGLGYFAMRKQKNHRQFENKDPSTLEETFNQSDCEEDIENYNYDENAECYPAYHVDVEYVDSNDKKSHRFGIGSAFGSSSGGKGVKKRGDKSGNKKPVLKKDQPLSCQDGNGMNAAPMDNIVDDLALDFLAGTGSSKKSKDKSVRDFRPKLLSAVTAFKPFQGEETEDDATGVFSKSAGPNTTPDFRPKLMESSVESLQGEDIDVSLDESTHTADRVKRAVYASNQDKGQENDEVNASSSRHLDTDSHLILSDIYEAAKKSRWERQGKSQTSAFQKRSASAHKVNDKLAKDLRDHRAKMNSFLDEDDEFSAGRGATTSSKIFNPRSLPQRERIPRIVEDDDSDVLKDFSFANDDESKGPHQSKKKFAVPPRFAKRNKNNTKRRRKNAEPDRRFFSFDGDDDEIDDYEDRSRIPNLVMADEKSGFASAVSSIGQLDYRGRERADRRVRFDRRTKKREPSVDTIDTNDAGAKLVACQSTLHKTKNIVTETLERSLHCKARVVSPTSGGHDVDDGDDQVARPWEGKWGRHKGKDLPVVEDSGYQSSNYDPDSDWDVDDNDMTVDYSADGSFMPSPLKGVGFDLRR